jgi:chromosome segregation ATPase
LSRNVEDLNLQLDDKAKENDFLKERIKALEDALNELKNRTFPHYETDKYSYEIKIEQIIGEKDHLEIENIELNKQNYKLNEELERAKRRIDELEKDLKDIPDYVDNTDLINRLKQEIKDLKDIHEINKN